VDAGGLSIWIVSAVWGHPESGCILSLGLSIHAERRVTSDSRLPLRKEEGLRGEKFQGEEFPQPLMTI